MRHGKLLIVFLFFGLISCNVRFDRYPGTPIKNIPPDLQGNYQMKKSGKVLGTYKVDDQSIEFTDSNKKETLFLKENFVITKADKWYFLCSPGMDSLTKVWDVYPIKPGNNKIWLFYLTKDDYFKPFFRQLGPYPGNKNVIQMNDELFLKFCDKNLKKRKGVKIKKIKS